MSSLPMALAASTALCVAFAATVRVRVPVEMPDDPQLIADHVSLERARRECDLDVMIADAYVSYHAVNDAEADLATVPMLEAYDVKRRRDAAYVFRNEVHDRIWACDGQDRVPRELMVHESHWSLSP